MYASEAFGMELLAAKFRVGAAGQLNRNRGCAIAIGQDRIWTQSNGWTANASGVLSGKRPVGSQRKKEATAP